MGKHKWTDSDRLVALFMYRYGITSLGDPEYVGSVLGMGASSLIARLSNYLAVATEGREGLPNYPPADERIFKKYGLVERADIERLVRHYLDGLASAKQ